MKRPKNNNVVSKVRLYPTKEQKKEFSKRFTDTLCSDYVTIVLRVQKKQDSDYKKRYSQLSAIHEKY